MKTCTIRRQAGKWFACFACEAEPEVLPESDESIGIDVGLNQFAALSQANASLCGDGTFVANPRFFRKDEKALAKAQQKNERFKTKSRPVSKVLNRRGKRKHQATRKSIKRAVARIHERIRNRRHDFVHQFSRRLVNPFGLIAVEKLNVKNMLGSHCLAKSISDASWSMFRSVLMMKAERAARRVVEVDPAYTSQDCHQCGNRAKKKLSERWHLCPICGASLDRDTNAAINILYKAASATSGKTAVGQHSVIAIAI